MIHTIKLWWRFIAQLMVILAFVTRTEAMDSAQRERGYIGTASATGLTVDQLLWDGIKHGDKGMVQKALEQGACVEGSFLRGTPLEYAINCEHVEIAKIIIWASGDITILNYRDVLDDRPIKAEIRKAVAGLAPVKAELGEQDWLPEEVSFVFLLPSAIEQIIYGYTDFDGDENKKELIISQIKRNKALNTLKRNKNMRCVCQ